MVCGWCVGGMCWRCVGGRGCVGGMCERCVGGRGCVGGVWVVCGWCVGWVWVVCCYLMKLNKLKH